MVKHEINSLKKDKEISSLKKDKDKEEDSRKERDNEHLKEINTADIPMLRFKVRFDYKGPPKPARFFFGKKDTEEVAQEIRDQQLSLWRNIPLQGIHVESIDLGEIYMIYDEELDDEVAFAPIELVVSADSLEDLIRFIIKDEFRRIEILEPKTITLTSKEMERMLFKTSEFLQKKFELLAKENTR